MRFCWTTIMVKDLEASLRFYEKVVGLTLQRRFQPAMGQDIAFLGAGETQVELISNDQKKTTVLGQDISLGFATDSLEELTQKLRDQGVVIHSGPFQPNPGIKFLYALDPDGLKIQFVEFLDKK